MKREDEERQVQQKRAARGVHEDTCVYVVAHFIRSKISIIYKIIHLLARGSMSSQLVYGKFGCHRVLHNETCNSKGET